MDAVVLAGGYATRLWPITIQKPKMLLPLTDNKVVFDYVLSKLENEDRVNDVYVNTNRGHYRLYQQFLERRSYTKPTLSVEDTAAEAEKHGVIGGLHRLVERENIQDDLLIIAGDNIITFDIDAFLDFQSEREAPVLAAYDVGSRQAASQYGVLETNGTRVTAFEEKPDNPNSTLASIACYYFPERDVRRIDTYLANDNNPDEPGWFIQWLYEQTPVHAYSFSSPWFDVGTPDSYLDAVAWANDEPVVSDSATVRNSTLDGTVLVMDGAVIEESEVSNSVVLQDASLANATVGTSIVGDEASIEDLSLHDSVVGPHDSLQGNDS